MNENRVTFLLQRYAEGVLTREERSELILLIEDAGKSALPDSLVAMIVDWADLTSSLPLSEASIQQFVQKVVAVDKEPVKTEQEITVMPMRNNFNWYRLGWAASVILFLSACAYLYLTSQDKKTNRIEPAVVQLQDVLPGGNKAVLTLGDGRQIILDSSVKGSIAQQGSAAVSKSGEGVIRYDLKGTASEQPVMNTLLTPRGGLYMLVLPDGSKVWLNAASSITYPVAFSGGDRKVKVSGEVYFEVTKDPTKPFIVEMEGGHDVQVLGTSFNINSYKDEGKIRTTLVEGSVRIGDQVVLRPGQQSVEAEGNLKVIDVNIDQVLAWRNGNFDFHDKKLEEVMRELSRWYDIDVRYEKNIPDIEFVGKVDKGLNLSQLLIILKRSKVNFRMEEGRVLIVSP